MRNLSNIFATRNSLPTITAMLCLATGSAIAGPAGSAVVTAVTDDIPLLAIGPITAIDREKGTVTVNGQSFTTDSQTGIYLQPTNLGDTDNLLEQDYVAIYGEIMDPGFSLATVISELPEEYVPGSSEVYLQLALDSNDSTKAIAASGQTVIDYSAALAKNDLVGTMPGDVVEFYGLAYGELFFATEAYAFDSVLNDNFISSSSASAQRGSGVRAQRGSGVRAQRGSGVRAQRGSGVRAQRGSGVRAQRGSGVRAQRGSGVRAQRGSGVRAQRGSGVRAQRGSGVRAQRGSGVRAQRGSGVRAQRGSGVRAQRGSGVRAQRGSGVRAQRGSGVR